MVYPDIRLREDEFQARVGRGHLKASNAGLRVEDMGDAELRENEESLRRGFHARDGKFAPLANHFDIGLFGIEGHDAAVENENFANRRIAVQQVKSSDIRNLNVIPPLGIGTGKNRMEILLPGTNDHQSSVSHGHANESDTQDPGNFVGKPSQVHPARNAEQSGDHIHGDEETRLLLG